MYVVENSCNSTCSSFTIKFFTFSGFNHWNNFVIILYEIPSTRSWYKQSRQNKTIFFKPTKNYINQKERGKIEAALPGLQTQSKKCTSSRCIKSALQSQDFFFCRGERGTGIVVYLAAVYFIKLKPKLYICFFFMEDLKQKLFRRESNVNFIG